MCHFHPLFTAKSSYIAWIASIGHTVRPAVILEGSNLQSPFPFPILCERSTRQFNSTIKWARFHWQSMMAGVYQWFQWHRRFSCGWQTCDRHVVCFDSSWRRAYNCPPFLAQSLCNRTLVGRWAIAGSWQSFITLWWPPSSSVVFVVPLSIIFPALCRDKGMSG